MEKMQLNIPLRRQIRNMSRFAQIVNVFARHGYWSVLERMEMRKVLNAEEIEEVTSISYEANRTDANPLSKLEGLPVRLRKSL